MASSLLNSLGQMPPAMDTINMKLPVSMLSQNSNSALSHTNLNLASTASKRNQKFKLDPIKILEPTNKKLSLPESQRVIYILEELVRRLEILDSLNLLVAGDPEKIRDIVRASLTAEEAKKNYENVFVSMCQHHHSLVETFDKGDFKNGHSAQSQPALEMLIKNSCKDLLRVLQKKPSLFDNLKKELVQAKPPINPKIVDLKNLINDVKELMHERLLITPVEQKEKIDYLSELVQREKANNELIRKLRDEQAAAQAEKEREIQTRNDQIRKLDSDLKNVEKFNADLIKRTKTEAEQSEASEMKTSEGKRSKLQTELNQLKQQFQNLVLEHRDQEQQLRKEKWKHETNVEGILGRYDEEMTKKQNEYDEIEALYEEEKAQLEELEEKFKPLEIEYNEIMEQRRIEERIRRMQEETLNKKVRAAIVIQSYWRGFKLRKGIKKGKGKKGKGKGKGKKKK